MNLFYSEDAGKSNGILSGDDHKHCTKVLRYRTGDEIQVFNGKGLLCDALITHVTKEETHFTTTSVKEETRKTALKAISICPVKSMDRLEWFVEKATEIGITDIYLMQCRRSEKLNINLGRLEKIALSATKQSLQLWKPIIHEMTPMNDLLSQFLEYKHKYIAHCHHTLPLLEDDNHDESSVLFIGPEGDFTTEEVNTAESLNFVSVSLGKTRLRTETAGIVGATMLLHSANKS